MLLQIPFLILAFLSYLDTKWKNGKDFTVILFDFIQGTICWTLALPSLESTTMIIIIINQHYLSEMLKCSTNMWLNSKKGG